MPPNRISGPGLRLSRCERRDRASPDGHAPDRPLGAARPIDVHRVHGERVGADLIARQRGRRTPVAGRPHDRPIDVVGPVEVVVVEGEHDRRGESADDDLGSSAFGRHRHDRVAIVVRPVDLAPVTTRVCGPIWFAARTVIGRTPAQPDGAPAPAPPFGGPPAPPTGPAAPAPPPEPARLPFLRCPPGWDGISAPPIEAADRCQADGGDQCGPRASPCRRSPRQRPCQRCERRSDAFTLQSEASGRSI